MSDFLVGFARRAKFGERMASRKLAMIALCNAANDSGDAIIMGAEEIAEAAELLSKQNAMRVRSELIGVGLISPVDDGDEPRAGPGRGAKGVYRINVKRLESLFAGEWDYASEAKAWRDKGAVTAPNESVPLQHPNDGEKGAAKGAVKGAALGAAKGVTAPHTPLSEVNKTLPPYPPRLSEREGGIEQILHDLRTAKPACERAIASMIEPLLRQRLFTDAPDPVYALGVIAEAAELHADAVLSDAVGRVKAARNYSFKPADAEAAINAAAAAAAASPIPATSDAPASAPTARLREALRLRCGDALFTSWFAAITFESVDDARLIVSVPVKFLKTYIDAHFAADVQSCARATFGVERVEIIVRQEGVAA